MAIILAACLAAAGGSGWLLFRIGRTSVDKPPGIEVALRRDNLARLNLVLKDYIQYSDFSEAERWLRNSGVATPEVIDAIRQLRDGPPLWWEWSARYDNETAGYEVFCLKRAEVWRAERAVVLVGASVAFQFETGSTEALIRFVAALKWPGAISSARCAGIRPHAHTRPLFVLDVLLVPNLWDEVQEYGEPERFVRGTFDGKEFKWLGVFDHGRRYDFDNLPDFYSQTQIQASVLNVPQSLAGEAPPAKRGDERQ
jgi:hypothetical protein